MNDQCRCLIEKCDPTVTWTGSDGQKKELGELLMGTRNYLVWSTKLEEWENKHLGSIVTPRPASPPALGRHEFCRAFRPVALALGMTSVAFGAAAVGIPAAAAVGWCLWEVRRGWMHLVVRTRESSVNLVTRGKNRR